MTRTIIADSFDGIFPEYECPDWYSDIQTLRGIDYHGQFGLFLYNLVKSNDGINTVLNLGTARGYSVGCIAHAINTRNDSGKIYTVDLIPADEPRNWHTPEFHNSEDPLKNKKYTMREVTNMFYDFKDSDVSVSFKTGYVENILKKWNSKSIDLVFYDVHKPNNYDAFTNSSSAVLSLINSDPIHVVRGSYYRLSNKEYHIQPDGWFSQLRSIPVGKSIYTKILSLDVKSVKKPELTRAVEEFSEKREWKKELIYNNENQPVSAFFS